MEKVPGPTIKRLILYYRNLEKLYKTGKKEVISSSELGNMVGVPAPQIRKDLSYCGTFGYKGMGYDIGNLKKGLENIIGLTRNRSVALVGIGNMGRALLYYDKLRQLGLNITVLFDNDLDKIGNMINGLRVNNYKNVKHVIGKRKIKIAVIAVPGREARSVAETLVGAGIKAIWNFAPVHIQSGEDVIVVNENLSPGVASLIYEVNSRAI